MKVLGISGSPRKGYNTELMVKEVLSTITVETEFISLAQKKIGPCIACLGWVEDNICKVGAIYTFFGPGTKINEETTPSLDKQPEKLEEARELGRMLDARLKGFAAAT